MDIAISMGTYYSYLKGNSRMAKQFLSDARVQVFNDGELAVDFDNSIRGKHIFIFGDTLTGLHELMMTIDAARRSSVKEITAILPFYNFSRQDKRGSGRGCIGAAVIAQILQSLGVDRVISIDLHAEQIQGYFQIPFEHLSGRHLFVEYIKENMDLTNLKLWSPDAGGVTRVTKFAHELNLAMGVMNKRREKAGVVGTMDILGNCEGFDILLIDDIIDTGGTLIKANKILMENGAKSVKNVITHPVLSGDSLKRVADSGIELITCNTRNTVLNSTYENIKVVDCRDFLLEAIYNVANKKSISTTQG